MNVYDFLVLYLICLMFVIVSTLCGVLKMKRIISQNPEFSFVISKINPGISIKVILMLVLPFIHLIPLVVYIVLCLISDESFIKIFQNIVEKEESMQLKLELKEKLSSMNDNDKIINELIAFLKGIDVTVNDLNEKEFNTFIDTVYKSIFNEDAIEAKKVIIEELRLNANILEKKIESEKILCELLKTKNDKDLYEKVKNIVKDIYNK